MLKNQSFSSGARRQLAAQKILMAVLIVFSIMFIVFEAYALFKMTVLKMLDETVHRQNVLPPSDTVLPQLLQTPCPAPPLNDPNSISIKKDFFHYLAQHLQNTRYTGIENYVQYVIAHLDLHNLDNVQPILPDFGIVLNDVRSIRYTISVPPCRPSAANTTSMFIAITSAPRNFEKRQMIRQTWLEHSTLYSPQLDVVGVAFVLGLTDDSDVEKAVAVEHETYGDILQVDMFDTYYNLSLKDAGLFNWLDTYCSSVDFYLRMDDDVYVNFNNLIRVMEFVDSNKPAIYGSISGSSPHRAGTWAISIEDWPWSTYPDYVRGPANLITKAALRPLLAAVQVIPYHPFDDLFVSGLCAEKARVPVYISQWFFVGGAEEVPDSCHVRESVTWLIDSPDHMNSSHQSTEKFYSGASKCEKLILNSENRTISLEEMFYYSFTVISREY